MRGKILVYNDSTGLISGEDGNRYNFSIIDWKGTEAPAVGCDVDFVTEGELAKNVFPLVSNTGYNKVVLAIVCWLFGVLGVHRFLVGRIGSGVVMLVLTCTVIGIIVTSIWVLVDLVYILTGTFKDKNGYPIK